MALSDDLPASRSAPADSLESEAPGTARGLKEAERQDLILKQFNARLAASRSHRQEWREEARTLYDMAAGRQWEGGDLEKLDKDDRPAVTFNVAGKYLDAVQGLQINNRQQIRFAPREPGDLQVNETLTGAVNWGRDLSQMQDDETDAFYDCILTGEGWMDAMLDRDLEPTGVPCGVRVDPLEMFPDPISRRRNYADARFSIRLKQVDPGEYRELYGVDDDESDDTRIVQIDDAEDEDPLTTITNPVQDYDGQAKGSLAVVGKRRPVADYQWVEREDAVVVMAQGMPARVYSKDEWAALEPRYRDAQIPVETKELKRRRFYRAIIAGGKVKTWGLSPDQSGFTHKAITGKRDRNKRCWYGIGRSIIEPQKWTNKFFSTILYALMTNSKGGLIAEENTFKDARKAEADWANPNSIVWVKDGALQKGKLEPKPVAQYPQGLDRLLQFSLEALPQTSGLNLEIMGMADRVQAGVVEAQRKQSAMSIIAWAFDAMRRYYVDMGRTLAVFVRDHMPEGTLVQIGGENGKQYVPLVKESLQIPFDVIVDEAPSSVNQQERVWAVLQQIIPQLLQAGMKIPKEVLDYSPLPSELQLAWKKVLTPDPETAAADKKRLEEMLRQLTAQNQKLEAEATLAQARAMEIQEEMRAPKENPLAIEHAKLQGEAFRTQIETAVEQRIAEFRANKDAETKMLIAQMQIDSKERIEQMTAIIDARLEQARIRADADSKETVAKIGAVAKAKDSEGEDEKPDPTSVLAETIAELRDVMKSQGKKPRGYKIKRDAKGDMENIVLDWGDGED